MLQRRRQNSDVRRRSAHVGRPPPARLAPPAGADRPGRRTSAAAAALSPGPASIAWSWMGSAGRPARATACRRSARHVVAGDELPPAGPSAADRAAATARLASSSFPAGPRVSSSSCARLDSGSWSSKEAGGRSNEQPARSAGSLARAGARRRQQGTPDATHRPHAALPPSFPLLAHIPGADARVLLPCDRPVVSYESRTSATARRARADPASRARARVPCPSHGPPWSRPGRPDRRPSILVVARARPRPSRGHRSVPYVRALARRSVAGRGPPKVRRTRRTGRATPSRTAPRPAAGRSPSA